MLTTIIEGPCYSAENVINACVGKITGLVRIVSGPGKCLRAEVPLSWNKSVPPVAYGSVDYTGLTRCTGNCTVSPSTDSDCPGGMPCSGYLVALSAMTDPTLTPTCLVTNHGWANYEGSAGDDQALVYVSYPDQMAYIDGEWTFAIGTGHTL